MFFCQVTAAGLVVAFRQGGVRGKIIRVFAHGAFVPADRVCIGAVALQESACFATQLRVARRYLRKEARSVIFVQPQQTSKDAAA